MLGLESPRKPITGEFAKQIRQELAAAKASNVINVNVLETKEEIVTIWKE